MPLQRRHKYILISLAFYWPAIFVATHVSIPSGLIGSIGMSDKTMHFLSYLALVSLLWFAVSPFEKVNWRKAKVWGILAVIVWYGAIDEWLQGFVGRDPDIMDFYTDISAAFTALIIMTFFSFWPALLILASFFIFAITCLTRVNIVFMNEYANSAFYFLAYSFFTLVWIQCSERFWKLKRATGWWFASSAGIPMIALSAMMLCSLAFGKSIWYLNMVTAASAIAASTAISYLTFIWSRRKKNKPDHAL